LRIADDVIVFAKEERELKIMLEDLQEQAKKIVFPFICFFYFERVGLLGFVEVLLERIYNV